MRFIVLLLLLLLAYPACSQSLDELLSDNDPFVTLPASDLLKLVPQLKKLEHQATPEQKLSIAIFEMRQLTIKGEFSAALKILKRLDKPSVPAPYRVRAYTIALPIFSAQGRYLEAFRLLKKMQRMIPDISHLGLRFMAVAMAPQLYLDSGDLNKALSFSRIEIAYARQTGNTIDLCTAYGDLAYAHKARRELQQARDAFDRMLSYCEASSAPLFMGMAHAGMGVVAYQQGDYAQAVEHSLKAVKLSQQAGYEYGVATSQLDLARSYHALGKTERAQQYLKQVAEKLQSMDLKDHLAGFYHLQGEISHSKGDAEAALQWFEKQWNVERQLNQSQKAVRLAQMRVTCEAKEQEKSILNQRRDEQLLLLQQRNSFQKLVTIVLGLLLLLMAALLFWSRRQQKRCRRQHLSYLDGLTGLPDQSHCRKLSEEPFQDCVASCKAFSVIVADIDRLGHINETYGHEAGDKVVKEAGHMLAACLSDYGVVGRTGGDRFIAFLPGVDAEHAGQLLKFCKEPLLFVLDKGQQIEVNLSYGVAVSIGTCETLAELIRHADLALYQGKQDGRNQVVVHTTEEN